MALIYYSVEEHQEKIPGVAEETPTEAGLQGDPEEVLDTAESLLDVEIHDDATEIVDDHEADKVVAEIAKEEAEIEYVRGNLERSEAVVNEMELQNQVIEQAAANGQFDTTAAAGFEAARRIAVRRLGLNPDEGVGQNLVDGPQLESYVEHAKMALEADNLPAVIPNGKDSANGSALEKVKKFIAEQWKKLMERLGKVREMFGKLAKWIRAKVSELVAKIKTDHETINGRVKLLKVENRDGKVKLVVKGQDISVDVSPELVSADNGMVDYKAALNALNGIHTGYEAFLEEVEKSLDNEKPWNVNVYGKLVNLSNLITAASRPMTTPKELFVIENDKLIPQPGRINVSDADFTKALNTFVKKLNGDKLVSSLESAAEFAAKGDEILNKLTKGKDLVAALDKKTKREFKGGYINNISGTNRALVNSIVSYYQECVKSARALTKLGMALSAKSTTKTEEE